MRYAITLTELSKPYPETTYFFGINKYQIMMDTTRVQQAKKFRSREDAQTLCDVLNRNYDETRAEVIEL